MQYEEILKKYNREITLIKSDDCLIFHPNFSNDDDFNFKIENALRKFSSVNFDCKTQTWTIRIANTAALAQVYAFATKYFFKLKFSEKDIADYLTKNMTILGMCAYENILKKREEEKKAAAEKWMMMQVMSESA